MMIYLAPVALAVLIGYTIWFYSRYHSFREEVPRNES
jgi:hypothetical protein